MKVWICLALVGTLQYYEQNYSVAYVFVIQVAYHRTAFEIAVVHFDLTFLGHICSSNFEFPFHSSILVPDFLSHEFFNL